MTKLPATTNYTSMTKVTNIKERNSCILSKISLASEFSSYGNNSSFPTIVIMKSVFKSLLTLLSLTLTSLRSWEFLWKPFLKRTFVM